MKTEERELIQSLLAPLTGLPEILTQDRQQLASLLAPLAALPDAVRALARTQGEDQPSLPGALAYAAREVARIAGREDCYVPSDSLASVVQSALREAREEGASQRHAEIMQVLVHETGIEEHGYQTFAGVVRRVREVERRRVLDELARIAGVEVVQGEDLETLVHRVLATYVQRTVETEQARAAQRALELQSELDTRFEEGRAQGRSENAAELERLQDYQLQLHEEARNQTVHELVVRSGHPAVNAGEALDTLACAIRDGLDAGASLRDVRERAQRSVLLDVLEQVEPGARHEVVPIYVSAHCTVEGLPLAELRAEIVRRLRPADAHLDDVRERAAQGALLALLDERCPGARHERVGLGKVEDLPAAELRAEVARRVGERSATDAQDERPGLLTALRAFGGRAAEGCENWTVDGLRLACANLGQAYRRMEAQCSVQVTKDVYEGLILQRDAYMQQAYDLDQRLRAALDAFEVDHTGADALRCVELLVASRNAWAKTLDEAESAYGADLDALASAQDTIATLDRILRPAVRTAGVPVEDATVIEIAERLVLVASGNHTALTAIDAELRRFLTACGEQLTGQERVLDLARRFVDANSRTVVEVPRSARDGARRELREIVSALGLRVEIDHLSLPEARAAVVRAVQALASDAPTDEATQTAIIAIRVLGQLSTLLGLKHEHMYGASVDADIEATARAIREHYVNVRHEDLARGQQLVIDAVCKACNIACPGKDEAIQTWASRLAEMFVNRAVDEVETATRTGALAVGADTSSEQRASVLAAVQALGGELPPEPTLGEACRELDDRIYALTYWAKDNLPLAAVWDIQLVETCPIAFEHLKKCAAPEDTRLASADDDPNTWAALARDLRAVSEGDEVEALASWLKIGQDMRAVFEAVLDRVSHLEEEIAEFDDQDEERKTKYTGAVREYVEDLARALYENFPLGVAPQLVARCARDLDRVDDPVVNGVRSLLAGAAGRAHEQRTLEDWVALHPTERNRLVDRTRDALAAVAA